ncbi:MAG: CHAT domain-containing protein [Bacteroidetes bacterium]|nr:CHAT domain-containing protein [Bacteroidota bacterium]
MSDLRTLITLSIQAVEGDPPSLIVHVRVGDEVVVSNRALAPEKAQEIQDFSRRFNERFERRYRRRVEEEVLQALGTDLFAFWLGDVWERVAERIPSGRRRWLVVASDVPDVLNLPWELVRPPRGEFLGVDPKFSIRRFPRIDRLLPDFEGALPPRPLRILFVACAPQDQHPLDYDREEEWLVEAIGKGRERVAFDSCDVGAFDELRERIDICQPHVVHMNGHGIVKDGLGHFCFEDERGQTDLRSSREMSQGLFAGTGVQCVFVSGCQTGKAPPIAALGGICQGLVGEEVPMAIGWAASIADDVAMKFAETFYRTLASGQPIERALKRARQDIRRMCKERGDPSWTLPVLYTATTQNLVFDPDPKRPPEQPTHPVVKLRPLPGMTEGYAAHFVGRRRETQRLLPALRDGTLSGAGLDVTDPNDPQLMWTLDSASLPGVGQTWSTPMPSRIDIRGPVQNAEKMVLVFGGGYDPFRP